MEVTPAAYSQTTLVGVGTGPVPLHSRVDGTFPLPVRRRAKLELRRPCNLSDSRRSQTAIRRLQGVIRKVAKTCNAIVEHITDVEIRTVAIEVDAAGASGELKSQLANIQ
ncbi:hypothetical protein NDU88_001730 [Pleurodeles waltl]|uniref:Asp23/Gls24 family envelope stress response protein n=1 Tax=Pleurodeles waltl TaxID=8319 RepID=A0AAV7P7P2_PLEWA|nr:hypothetical protein NDU88_001730 [Pleurodeles waltl]